eukprot:4769704-Amphidinium_carterae.1
MGNTKTTQDETPSHLGESKQTGKHYRHGVGERTRLHPSIALFIVRITTRRDIMKTLMMLCRNGCRPKDLLSVFGT